MDPDCRRGAVDVDGRPAAATPRLGGRGRHDVVIVEVDSASGGNPNRPGWKRMMGAVRGGHIEIVAVTGLHRAMRSPKHFLDLANELLQRSIDLKVLDQPDACMRNTGDSRSNAVRTLAKTCAELEGDLIREMSNEGHYIDEDGKMRGPSGKPVGRRRIYGPEHKFRRRGDRLEHDKARCKACGASGG